MVVIRIHGGDAKMGSSCELEEMQIILDQPLFSEEQLHAFILT
jgi:hypothetical protein